MLIVINHLCPKNLILTLCEVNPEQSPTKPNKTQIDLTKASTKGRLFCQEKKSKRLDQKKTTADQRLKTKFSKMGFSIECVTADFLLFSVKMSKCIFRVAVWVLAIKSEHSNGFLEIS